MLENEYLTCVVEPGLVAGLVLVVFFVVPTLIALGARRWSLTLDSLSFPMFVNVNALVIGLTGACSPSCLDGVRGPALAVDLAVIERASR